jgi:hypothetical protein
MPWFLVDDDFAFHPKADAAGDAAIGLWTRAGSYCMRYLTEGFVSAADLRQLRAKPTQIKALVAAGLWIEVEGGYQFHDWRQRTKAQVEADRAAAAERQRRRRAKDREDPPPPHRPDAASRRESRRDGKSNEATDSHDTRTGTTQSRSACRDKNLPRNSGIDAGQSVSSRRESHDPGQARPNQTNPLLTLAGRLTEVDARGLAASLPAGVIDEWQQIAGPGVDLEAEARAYLARHGDTTPRNPRGAWLGWLRAARRRADAAAPPPQEAAGKASRPACARSDCLDGWLVTDDDAPRPCPTCKPHLRPVPNPADTRETA